MRNEPDARRSAPEAADEKIPLPYQGHSPARRRRSSYDLMAGVAAALVLAVSAAGLVMVQVAALGGTLRGYPALYVTATLLSLLMIYWSFRVTRYYFQATR